MSVVSTPPLAELVEAWRADMGDWEKRKALWIALVRREISATYRCPDAVILRAVGNRWRHAIEVYGPYEG